MAMRSADIHKLAERIKTQRRAISGEHEEVSLRFPEEVKAVISGLQLLAVNVYAAEEYLSDEVT